MLKVKSLKLVNEKNIKYDLEKITSPKNVFEIMEKIGATDRAQEYIYIMCLDTKNNINCISNVGIGTLDNAVVDKRILFQYMYLTNSNKMILVHNHPTGNIEPSKCDIKVTQQVNEICKMLDFELLDHIIISSDNYTSIKEKGGF